MIGLNPTLGCAKLDQMFTLYLDESGDWGFPRYHQKHPILCLCGTVIEDSLYRTQVKPAINRIKKAKLRSQNVILHRAKLTTRTGQFATLKTDEAVSAFSKRMSARISELDLTFIISALDKPKFLERYSTRPVDDWLPTDVYTMLFVFVVERFVAFLHQHDKATGSIIVESRGSKENVRVQNEFTKMLRDGTQFYRDWQFREVLRVPAVRFYDKSKGESEIGLQISDWVALPLAKTLQDASSPHPEWSIYKEKIWLGGNPSKPGQVGLKTFPEDLGRDLLGYPLEKAHGS